jgi:putative photosynthetic complex assembly protein 2
LAEFALPILHAVFVWWFATGVILYLDGLPTRTFKWSMLAATAIFGVALYGLNTSAGDATVSGAYAAFSYGLLAWGWQEISFYMGYVTGPRRHGCPEGCRGWRHFWHAVQTSLYHEISIVVTLAVIVALTWNQPNQVGLWTFVALWWMHESARLNVFLGVRNLNEEFLPDHMEFLKSFFNNRQQMNLLFPISVTVSTVVTVLLAQAALSPTASEFELVGYTFVATMMTLAILEHWFLVLPLPAAALWNWSLRSRTPQTPAVKVEILAGFMGAGKTTVLRRRLADAPADSRVVALVHDCGPLAGDGHLVRGPNGDKVTLPDGHVCFGLREDLAHQFKEVLAATKPDRVLIEPSGIADVGVLTHVLKRADIRPSIKGIRFTVVIDASAFMADYARLPDFLRAQVQASGHTERGGSGGVRRAEPPPTTFIVNKADLVAASDLATLTGTLQALNPAARIVTAVFGITQDPLSSPPANDRIADRAGGPDAPGPIPAAATAAGVVHHHHHHHHHYHAGLPPESLPDPLADEAWGGTPDEAPGEVVVLDLRAWSADLSGRMDPDGLRGLLDEAAGGAFGTVETLTGIARVGDGWVRFRVEEGRASVEDLDPAPDPAPEARVVAVGSALDGARLRQAFTRRAGGA